MTIKEFFEKYANVEFPEEQEKHIKDLLGIKKSKKWKPEIYEKYYFIDKNLSIQFYHFENDNLDNINLFTNNCFKTIEEAEFRLEQIKVYNELKNFADENNEEMDWNNTNQQKCNLSYNYNHKEIEIGCVFWCKYVGEIYFSSEELAQQAIEKVGADRIKKYLFGVEQYE